jgi:hypothetical protein
LLIVSAQISLHTSFRSACFDVLFNGFRTGSGVTSWEGLFQAKVLNSWNRMCTIRSLALGMEGEGFDRLFFDEDGYIIVY